MGVLRSRRQTEYTDVDRTLVEYPLTLTHQLTPSADLIWPSTASARSAPALTLPTTSAAVVSALRDEESSSANTTVGLWLLVGFCVGAMAFMLFSAVSYHCAETLRWLKENALRGWEQSMAPDLTKQAAIRISHSLPDLKRPTRQEYVQDNKVDKKVLRQTTLPAVTSEHQKFQRQLSYRLDPMPQGNIQFSVCSLDRSNDNVGIIKPELYRDEALKRGSADSTADMEYCGKLHFALLYDKEIEALKVKVLEAHDLPIKDITGSSDPYVKVYLLPDLKKHQTKVHRKNLNPVFNETFIFSVPYKDLPRRYLQFSVYDFDRFSRHDQIGQVVLKGLLDNADLTQEIEYTMNILCPKKERLDRGELMLSLCYLPIAGRLTVTVIKARNLKAMDITGSSDPYVKVNLYCQGERMKKRKTSVMKSTLTPVYNEALVFEVPSQNISDVYLVVQVIDYDRIGSNELMGCTAIGSACNGVGRDHWQEMLDNPRKPVAQWYPLLDDIPGYLPENNCQSLPVSLSCLNGAR